MGGAPPIISSVPRPGQVPHSGAGPSTIQGRARLSGFTVSLPHGAEPPQGPQAPPRHLRRSRETRARSPTAPGPSALLLQRPSASHEAVASGKGRGRLPPPPSIKPGSLLRALQVCSGGPAASRAGPQYSAHTQASAGPDWLALRRFIPSAPPERWNQTCAITGTLATPQNDIPDDLSLTSSL
ncbi:hypothetical protein NDU88_005049 [Pleurodeles waltl]|uniref:Uncharacterized protein n=1 Tax=Pleurodeles waltl TaxID=8319 RepID=A0AAV7L1Z9_PLEWA|nr:hypothetical protein NDU88_005049 [Pleurodeles waltl]